MVNPFEVNTPEGILAKDVHELFVDVFSDFHQVPKVGHTFLNGPRGSGKSMMFRYMMPDCQIIEKGCLLNELDYFALYVPIKLTDLNNKEIEKLKTNSYVYINEHLLTTFIAIKCFKSLLIFDNEINNLLNEFKDFYQEVFLWHLDIAGFDIKESKKEYSSTKDYITAIIKLLDRIYRECLLYCKRSLDEYKPYKGPLMSYLDFLFPILQALRELSFFPEHKPFYILIDDAGYLNEIQTQILNTWVSYRTSNEVSLKISTQLDYKSYKTITNKTIDFPHDYSQVNIATLYTTSHNTYYKRIKDIVKKRLKTYFDKEVEPRSFFPANQKQEEAINELKIKLKEDYYDPEKSHAAGDASRRYASSEYIKALKKSRSGSTLSYAGFDNLVDISSGIIRHFLEPASIMFSEFIAQNSNVSKKIPDYIPENIQNEIIQNYSKKFLDDEFVKIKEVHIKKEGEKLSKADKLHNLITGLGEIFHLIFTSDKAERIVFSVALNDAPNDELQDILDLAEHYGYLHKSTIGNKMGTGRSRLYVLSRTLAPYFRLDPAGFKGYQFMNSSMLSICLTNPRRFVSEMKKEINNDKDTIQLDIFDEES
ncbi:ORC-CDC6 family AAA ATPase [Emticicia agri]|uniref:Uncharacterized protein n=1 Tax=Emticicia agri TaxID=2492393 RepID=A0A4Q5LUK0_9BACT|nr:hypothetical protein [Emticicia agri]RYU93169.1 hypothetical protein EWM59_23340 [Emticicia agri]